MKIGYSCWGFLGKGIIDTPDGGRSHRLVLLKELIRQGSTIIMLQKNRDLVECNQDFTQKKLSFGNGFPQIDALFLEYRWKIPGRNCELSKNDPSYTPDLDRQNELIEFYQKNNIPIFLWDKDQKLTKTEEQKMKNVIVFEPVLKPRFNRKSLLFPINSQKTTKSFYKLKNYNQKNKKLDLIYIGNQYERDDSFKEFIDNPAGMVKSETLVYGNWKKYPDWCEKNLKKFPNVKFKERLAFSKVNGVYKKSFSTALIAPDLYYNTGHFTQRLFESMWGLCIPFVPDRYYGIEKIIIKEFIVHSGHELSKKILSFRKKSNLEIRELLRKQFKMLDTFSSEKQAKIILNAVRCYYENV